MLGRIIKFLYTTIFVFFVLLFVLSHLFSDISELARSYITGPVRDFLTFFTNLFPFAVFEALGFIFLFLIPFMLIRIIRGRGSAKPLTFILSFFILGYIISLGIDSTGEALRVSEPTDEDYLLAGEYIVEKLRLLSGELDGVSDIDGDFLSTISIEETKNIPNFKNSYISSCLTRLGTLSYYSPFTMEIILNKNQPAFMKRFSLAHELSHYLGYIREDEASLYAFSLLLRSEDKENLYSAYLFAFSSVGREIYQKSPDDYMTLFNKVPPRVKKDLKSRSNFLLGESDNSIGDALNDRVIRALDVRGALAYSNSASLIVNYIISYEL